MATFRVYLKDKDSFFTISADTAETTPDYVFFKNGGELVGTFRPVEVQGYYKESEKK